MLCRLQHANLKAKKMSTEYKTLRVIPEVYDRVHEIQEKLSALAEGVMPASTHRITYDHRKEKMVSVGSVIAIALESLDREMDVMSKAYAETGKKAPK